MSMSLSDSEDSIDLTFGTGELEQQTPITKNSKSKTTQLKAKSKPKTKQVKKSKQSSKEKASGSKKLKKVSNKSKRIGSKKNRQKTIEKKLKKRLGSLLSEDGNTLNIDLSCDELCKKSLKIKKCKKCKCDLKKKNEKGVEENINMFYNSVFKKVYCGTCKHILVDNTKPALSIYPNQHLLEKYPHLKDVLTNLVDKQIVRFKKSLISSNKAINEAKATGVSVGSSIKKQSEPKTEEEINSEVEKYKAEYSNGTRIHPIGHYKGSPGDAARKAATRIWRVAKHCVLTNPSEPSILDYELGQIVLLRPNYRTIYAKQKSNKNMIDYLKLSNLTIRENKRKVFGYKTNMIFRKIKLEDKYKDSVKMKSLIESTPWVAKTTGQKFENLDLCDYERDILNKYISSSNNFSKMSKSSTIAVNGEEVAVNEDDENESNDIELV